VINWLKQRFSGVMGKEAPARHCRLCGAVVPVGENMCPKCHGMDIDSGPLSERQQKDEDSRSGA
jgi:hypothetical protein